MKAAVLTSTAKSEDLKKLFAVKDIPIPEYSDDEILINIKYASLNHRDLWIARGMYSRIKLPAVLGSDGAGVVSAVGKNVEGFSSGDEVIINPGFNWGASEEYQSKDFRILGMPDNGTLAEYISVNKSYVHKKPAHLDLSQASVIPLAGVTAYRALFKKAKLRKKDSLLLTGIGGGAATLALVFALKVTSDVFVTSGNDDKILKAVSFGARGGVNYKDEHWAESLTEMCNKNINVAIDSSGQETFSKLIEICSYGGRIVSYGATNGNAQKADLYKTYWKQLKIFGTAMGSPKDFSDMIDFINNKKVSPIMDSVYAIEEIAEAFKRMEESKQFGKIVIRL